MLAWQLGDNFKNLLGSGEIRAVPTRKSKYFCLVVTQFVGLLHLSSSSHDPSLENTTTLKIFRFDSILKLFCALHRSPHAQCFTCICNLYFTKLNNHFHQRLPK